ncbi:MAG: hypothetical protein J7K14_01775, partial [Sulfurimonas sp.]|nr:hypothetical protein [Sulfurimonas sp.]
ACGSPFRQVKPNEIIESRALSIVVPDINWQIPKGYNKEKYKKKTALPYIYHLTENIQFSIYTSNYLGEGGFQEELFKKDGHYHDSDVERNEISKIGKETGVTYSKGWITYVNHLKCTGGVFSRGFGGSYYSGGVKFYGIECGYYDTAETKNDGKRMLNINYRYTHNTKKPQEAQQREKIVKQAVEKAISTLKIKNIDIPRMEKEGLIHYDKEFESTKW